MVMEKQAKKLFKFWKENMDYKQIVIFTYTNFILGGAETLILRMSEWFMNNNTKVYIICNSIDDLLKNEYEEKNLKIYISNKKKDILSLIFKKELDKKIIVVNFFFEEYLNCEQLRKKHQFYNFFYVVHPHRTIVGKKLPNHISNVCKRIYKKMFIQMYEKENIIYMDEECIKIMEDYYSLNLPKAYKNIVRLPIKVQDVKTPSKNKKFNILTISRFDFPFKGYILGLIEDFAFLAKQNPEIILTIIGDGKDKDKVIKKIEELDKNIQKKIYLIGNVPYSELNTSFASASVYIGMGTTLLDASNMKLPVIPVLGYTYQNFSSGFFYKMPNFLGTDFNNYNSIAIKSLDLIKDIISMDNNQYQNLCEKNYKEFCKVYNIDKIMPLFLANSTTSPPPKVIVYKIIRFLEIIKKIKNKVRFNGT